MRRPRAEATGRLSGALVGAVLLASACLLPVARAQVSPVFTAPLVHGQAASQATIPAPREALSPQRLVQWFEQACIATQGDAAAAIDWALSNGFEPVDPTRGSMDTLLGGKPGTVLVAPEGGGDVMLAAADAQCSLWIDRQEGPPLRTALAALVGQLAGKGAKAQVQIDRTIERVGAWRSQVQWRYRAVGGSRDLGIGAVTTLTAAPATQVLHVAPLAGAVRFSPEGVPLR